MAKFVVSDPPHEASDLPDDVLPITVADPSFRVGARLCNFPTNKETIRSTHEKWISDNLVPLFKDVSDCSIDLTGHASRLGSAAKNSPLSARRIEAVHGLIESKTIGSNVNLFFQRSDPRGEEEAEGFGIQDGDNSGRFRAVDVLAFAAQRPPRIIIPKLTPIGATKFKVRVVLSTGLGLPSAVVEAMKKALDIAKNAKVVIPVTADIVLFEIAEDMPGRKNLKARFAYVGGGFGLSQGIPVSKSPPPGGVTLGGAGPFSKFTTSRPVLLPTFAGEATLGAPPGISIGPKSLPFTGTTVQLTIESNALVSAKAVTSPRNIVITTGAGFSITLFSITKGALIMISPPRLFSGP